jgi:RNA polymerase sigma factor (sigma-70 family)
LGALGDDRLVAQLRRGNDAAFEVLYDRHSGAVLSYCRHMLGSPDEAEDALQQSFVSAHADIVSTDKPIRFKPWLYTIARNRCLSILRARRELPSDRIDRVSTAGLSEEVQHRADLQELLRDLHELPGDQRSALILSELGDLSHAEVAEVIGCEVAKVKSLVFQARSGLIERRQARETPCEEIREQLATLRGGSLRRGPLRRHLKSCPGCAEFREDVRRQRQMVSALLPVVPTLALRDSALAAVGIATSSAGTGALAGGGAGAVVAAKATVAKVAVVAIATTGTVGGVVAVERTTDGGSDRGATQSQDAVQHGAGSDAAAHPRRGVATKHVTGQPGGAAKGPDKAARNRDGRAKNSAQADHKRGFTPVQGGSNGEGARDFAAGRGNGQHRGLQKPIARGGANGKARGPKPQGSSRATPQRPAAPGPRNENGHPTPKAGLQPLLPAAPEFRPHPREREEPVSPEKRSPQAANLH